jgi:hypothetical protein
MTITIHDKKKRIVVFSYAMSLSLPTGMGSNLNIVRVASEQEAAYLKHCQGHDNVVTLLGYYNGRRENRPRSAPVIVMEYVYHDLHEEIRYFRRVMCRPFTPASDSFSLVTVVAK